MQGDSVCGPRSCQGQVFHPGRSTTRKKTALEPMAVPSLPGKSALPAGLPRTASAACLKTNTATYQSWQVISPDLTLNVKSHQQSSGGIATDNLMTFDGSVLFAIEESNGG